MNTQNDVDFCFLSDAMELLRKFPVCHKNVNQAVDIVVHAKEPLAVWQVLNRLVRHYGGARWGATYKLAQAFIVGAVTVNNQGFVEVVRG